MIPFAPLASLVDASRGFVDRVMVDVPFRLTVVAYVLVAVLIWGYAGWLWLNHRALHPKR